MPPRKALEISAAERALIERMFEREFHGGPEKWGKLHNVTRDTGGWTKYGIAQNKNPDIDVVTLTYDRAVEFYARRYLQEARIALIPEPGLQEQVFDFAVNAGVHRAIKTLQELLFVPATGFIGERTLAGVGNADAFKLAHAYLDARARFYRSLVAKKPANQQFLAGWLNRVDSLRPLPQAA